MKAAVHKSLATKTNSFQQQRKSKSSVFSLGALEEDEVQIE